MFSFLTFSCPSSDYLAVDFISGNNTKPKDQGDLKKEEEPNPLRAILPQGLWNLHLFWQMSYPPSASGAQCPLDLLCLWLSLWLHTLLCRLSLTPGFSFCPWAKDSQISHLEFPGLPSTWSAQLSSDLFTWMCPLGVTSSLICQRETHPLFTLPLWNTILSKLSAALPTPSISFFQPWSYITNRCHTFAPKSVGNDSHSFFFC